MKTIYAPVSELHKKRERAKARELRQTHWWKLKLAKGICYHCGKSFMAQELTMDHLIPIGRGGHSDRNNVVTSCKSCNSSKKASLAGEWEPPTA